MRTGAILAAILLVGLILRISYLREIVNEPDFSFPRIDSGCHDYWAHGSATGDWSIGDRSDLAGASEIRSIPYMRPPGYPYFLASVYYLTGGRYLAARIFQMGLGLVNCVLAYFLGKRLFGRVTGLIFATFMSAYWAFI